MIRYPVSGAILAGGKSLRMGTQKALVVWNNKPLVQWVFESMQEVCSEVLIIANEGDFSFLNARVYPDNLTGNGPAGGIESALSHASTNSILISSCDTPNLDSRLFRHLIDHHGDFDISICGHDGTDEPLIGLFNRSVRDVFRSSILSGNNRPPRIIRQTRWQAVEITPDLDFYQPDLFLNLNYPSDLEGIV